MTHGTHGMCAASSSLPLSLRHHIPSPSKAAMARAAIDSSYCSAIALAQFCANA